MFYSWKGKTYLVTLCGYVSLCICKILFNLMHSSLNGFLPSYNAYGFLLQNAKKLEIGGGVTFVSIDVGTLLKSGECS